MSKRTNKCQICENEYQTYNVRSVACSRSCLNLWRQKTYTGRKFTDEHKNNMRNAKLRENVRKEGDYRCDVCLKLFSSNTSLRSHKSYCSSVVEQKNVNCSFCDRVFKRKRHLLWHVRFHDELFVQQHTQKVVDGISDRKPQKRNSSAEIEFMNILKQFHNDVLHKHRVDGINHEYDFFVPSENLLIEFDGDYWHGNPEKYVLTQKMKRQYCIDRHFTMLALERGYAVRRIWQSLSHFYPECLRTLEQK